MLIRYAADTTGRSERIRRSEKSSDLASWHSLDAPENNSIPRPAGIVILTIPMTTAQSFYRGRLVEN